MGDCLFCKIEGEIPSDKLYEDDMVLAILDINPRAPVHFMVVPREHIEGRGRCAGSMGRCWGGCLRWRGRWRRRRGWRRAGSGWRLTSVMTLG